MKAVSRVLSFLDDAINPIAMKELRQAVQSRFVTAMLLLFLLGQLAVVGGAVMFDEDITRSFDSGRGIFSILLGVLLFTCIVFVPIYAGVRLSSERSDTNVDLLFITTIRPGAIVRGKMLAAMILALLIYGACMPFMTFTYLLRGLDIPSIFLTLLLGFFATATAVMFSIFIASLPLGRFLRILLGLGLLGALITLLFFTIAGSMGIIHLGVGSMTDSKEFWGVIGTITALTVSGIGFFYVLAIASLSPPSSNRTLPLRIYIPIIWLLNGVVAVLWVDSAGEEDAVVVWMVFATFLFCISLFVIVSERDFITRRMKRQIPRIRLLRLIVFPFYAGAAGGVIWWLVLVSATFVFAWAALFNLPPYFSFRPYMKDVFVGMIVFALYIFCYCMTALFIRRVLLPQVRNTVFTAVIALILMILGCIVPVFLAFMCDPSHWDLDDAGYWSMGNPFFIFDCRDDYRMNCLALTIVWGSIIAALNLPWLVKRALEFTPQSIPTPQFPEQP